MLARPVRRAATALVLLTLLTACSGIGDDDTSGGGPGPDAAAALPVPSARATVTPDDAAAYVAAQDEMSLAFHRFTTAYEAAVKANDLAAVTAAATSLSGAVTDFDDVVQTLDLAAIQSLADRLLRLNAEVVTMLEAVPRARSAARAIRIMEMLPYQDYVTAYEALVDAI
jgi:hypothetical protein